MELGELLFSDFFDGLGNNNEQQKFSSNIGKYFLPNSKEITDDGKNVSFTESSLRIDYFYDNANLPCQHGILISFYQGAAGTFQLCVNFESKIYSRIYWGVWKEWVRIK